MLALLDRQAFNVRGSYSGMTALARGVLIMKRSDDGGDVGNVKAERRKTHLLLRHRYAAVQSRQNRGQQAHAIDAAADARILASQQAEVGFEPACDGVVQRET